MESANGIFAGVRILEFGSGAAGPVATRYFAEQGATVVRVESAERPDFLRLLRSSRDRRFGLDGSAMFILLNPDKMSVAVNLSKPAGVEVAKRLVAWADAVCENFSPGVMARWGLDYESLKNVKPDLVMVSGCLFGQTGPQRHYPGFGGQGSAIAGFNHLTGWPDREAVGPYATITDSLSPRFAALALAAALLVRRRTGRGQYIDLSQIEAGVYSLSEMIVRRGANGEIVGRRGNRSELAAPHSVYPCRGEDRWIAIAVHSDSHWKAFLAEMGNPLWGEDPRFATTAGRLAHEEEIDGHVAQWTRGFEAYGLMGKLQAAGVEAGVVQNFDDLLHDPQLTDRGHFRTLSHVHLGELPFERSGLRFSESSGQLHAPGPNLGEHNEVVLGELLGMSRAEIARLAAERVLL